MTSYTTLPQSPTGHMYATHRMPEASMGAHILTLYKTTYKVWKWLESIKKVSQLRVRRKICGPGRPIVYDICAT